MFQNTHANDARNLMHCKDAELKAIHWNHLKFVDHNILFYGNGNGIYIPVLVMVFIYIFIYINGNGIYIKCGLHLTTQPMNHEIAQRPDQHTGNSTPYSLR